jgi:hypothetical protein
MIQSTKNNLAGLWYPMVIAAICFVVGALLIKETKDRNLSDDTRS